VGLLAMKDELADLRGAPVAAQFKKDIKPGPRRRVRFRTGRGRRQEPGAFRPRSLITSNATRGSGGINTAALGPRYRRRRTRGSFHHGGPGVIGGDGGGGAGGGGTLRRGGSGKASRSIEDIKLVFDRNKGSIYTLYNRALREDPTLQGKVVVKLTIAPSGQVLDCQLVSSELRSPDLERKVLLRIKQFDFGARSRGRDGGDLSHRFPAVVTDSA